MGGHVQLQSLILKTAASAAARMPRTTAVRSGLCRRLLLQMPAKRPSRAPSSGAQHPWSPFSLRSMRSA